MCISSLQSISVLGQSSLCTIYTHFVSFDSHTNISCHNYDRCMLAYRGSWMDVWELMSQECRDEVVLIDSACLLETLETYLRKHR